MSEIYDEKLIGYILRYGGMCRDCADMDGVCQSGQPCDTNQREAVVRHTLAALTYGVKHGFIANPFAADEIDRLTRELAEARDKALEEAATVLEEDNANGLERQICCDGQMCGCQGSAVGEYAAHLVRALKEKP